jgi:hypothetical protein
MSRIVDARATIAQQPFRLIEAMWGGILIGNAVYLLWPTYSPSPGSIIENIAASRATGITMGIIYLVTGALAIYASLYRGRNWRRVTAGLFFMAFLLTALLRVLSVGLTPTVWVWPLLLALASAVNYLHIQWQRET